MVGLLAIIYVALSVLTWLQSYIMINVSLKTIQTLRQDLFNQFQSLSLKFFDKRAHGELMSRVTNDIVQLNNALSQSVVQIFSTILTVAVVTIAMFLLNWHILDKMSGHWSYLTPISLVGIFGITFLYLIKVWTGHQTKMSKINAKTSSIREEKIF